jgi:hypothetical protein
MAADFGVSIACVCRALQREGLMTARQTARKRRRQHYPEAYPDATTHALPGNRQRQRQPVDTRRCRCC